MATGGKVPLLGFIASVRNLVLLGFGLGGVEDAYLDDFIEVPAVGRMVTVQAVGRMVTVPASGRGR